MADTEKNEPCIVMADNEPCTCGSPGLPHIHPRYADNSIWEPYDFSGKLPVRMAGDPPSVQIIAKG